MTYDGTLSIIVTFMTNKWCSLVDIFPCFGNKTSNGLCVCHVLLETRYIFIKCKTVCKGKTKMLHINQPLNIHQRHNMYRRSGHHCHICCLVSYNGDTDWIKMFYTRKAFLCSNAFSSVHPPIPYTQWLWPGTKGWGYELSSSWTKCHRRHFCNTFPWTKRFVFWFKFHWSLFLMV